MRAVPINQMRNFVLLLLIHSSNPSLATATFSSAMEFVLVKGGLVPTSGMTLLGPVFSGSVGRCAAACVKLSAQCNSFTFQPSTSCQQTTFVAVGTCQLMYFTVQDEVVLGPATISQSFYVAEWCDDHKKCMNSGTCDMTRWPHFCQCPHGYGGTYCGIAFDYIAAYNVSYKPIFELMFWGEATVRCQKLDRSAHLATPRSLNEYLNLVNYLQSSPIASQSSKCYAPNFPADFCGYWVAKRRLNVYAADQATCLASPFVWAKYNSTAGLLPELAWESTTWTVLDIVRMPDCAVGYPFAGMIETCVSIAMGHSYTMNDVSCVFPTCAICQVDDK